LAEESISTSKQPQPEQQTQTQMQAPAPIIVLAPSPRRAGPGSGDWRSLASGIGERPALLLDMNLGLEREEPRREQTGESIGSSGDNSEGSTPFTTISSHSSSLSLGECPGSGLGLPLSMSSLSMAIPGPGPSTLRMRQGAPPPLAVSSSSLSSSSRPIPTHTPRHLSSSRPSSRYPSRPSTPLLPPQTSPGYLDIELASKVFGKLCSIIGFVVVLYVLFGQRSRGGDAGFGIGVGA